MSNKYLQVALLLALLLFFYSPISQGLGFVQAKTSAIQFLQDNIGDYRMASYQNAAWKIQDIRGYEIAGTGRYRALKNRFDDNHKVFNLLGVKYFIQDKNDSENTGLASIRNLLLVYNDESVEIYENKEVVPRAFLVFDIEPIKDYHQALDVFSTDSFKPEITALVETENPENLSFFDNRSLPYRPAKIVSYSPNEIEIITDGQKDGYLVLTDVYYPGWQAYLDDQEVETYPTDVAFEGLFVPSGEHRIVLQYHPKSLFYFIYISIAALLIILLLIWIKLR